MSFVTSVVLLTSLSETDGAGGWNGPPKLVEQINDWLGDHAFGALGQVEGHAGGSKHPECFIFAAGYNYFCEDDFVDMVLDLPWENPESLVLILRTEGGPARVHHLGADIASVEKTWTP